MRKEIALLTGTVLASSLPPGEIRRRKKHQTKTPMDTIDRKQLDNMTVQQLRALAREFCAKGQIASAWVAAASKDALVRWLGSAVDGDTPELPLPSDPTPAPAPASDPAPAPTDKATSLAQLAGLLQSLVPAVDMNEVRRVAEETAKRFAMPRTVRIQVNDQEPREISRQHYRFPLLVVLHQLRIPAMLVGPAGTGKTHAAFALAEMASCDAAAESFNAQTSKADLFGFRDAQGNVHTSKLCRIARDGGVFVADELDAANPTVLTQCNMLLSNGVFSAPDGMHRVHGSFYFIGCANTYGSGADRLYVGRNELDAASLSRYAIVDWPVDEGLESTLAGMPAESPKFRLDEGGTVRPEEWLKLVRAYRAAAEKLRVRALFCSRSVMNGARCAEVNVGKRHLIEMFLRKGIESATWDKLTKEANV